MSKIIKAYDQNFIACSPQNCAMPYQIKPATKKVVTNSKSMSPAQILEQAQEEAKRIIEQAQAISSAKIKEATELANNNYEAEMNRAKSKGFEAGKDEGAKKGFKIGFDEGLKKGEIEAENITQKTIQFMHGVIEGIDEGRHDLLKKYQDDLKDVAFLVAEKILKKEIEEHPETIKNIIDNAAQMCKNQDYIRVNVSSKNYKLLMGDKELELRLNSYSKDIKFIVDENISDTGCIIETPLGVIDAGVETQLENIKTAISDEER